MGQYYKIAFKHDGKVLVSQCLGKLMEFSWIHGHAADSVASRIFHVPTKFAFIGDYADDEAPYVKDVTNGAITQGKVWGSHAKRDFKVWHGLFNYKGLKFVNHDKEEYIDFDKYIGGRDPWKDEEYVVNPIPLMTAIGNGRGSGDYRGQSCPDVDKVGTWAWDLCSIETDVPDGFKEIKVGFRCSM